MPIPVSLKEVGGELEALPDEATAFINRKTGEVLTMGDDYLLKAEEGVDPKDLSDWEREMVELSVQIRESGDYLELPSKFDMNEYSIMEKFCWSIEDEGLSDEMTRTIQGSGAFRRFRSAVEHHNMLDKWYAYKKEAYEDIAAKCLLANDIPFVRP